MGKFFVCKVCGSERVEVFHVPKGEGNFITFVWCRECNSVNDGELIEIEEKQTQEVENEAR